jgi:hypothetical protein
VDQLHEHRAGDPRLLVPAGHLEAHPVRHHPGGRSAPGRWRLWATASPKYWAHLDLRRPKKREALVLDLATLVKPFITPDDPDAVAAIIALHS